MCDPAIVEGNFFQTGNLPVLVFFNCFDKICGIHQGLMRTGIQPGKSVSEQRDIQIAVFQINAVQIRDFQFTAELGFRFFA